MPTIPIPAPPPFPFDATPRSRHLRHALGLSLLLHGALLAGWLTAPGQPIMGRPLPLAVTLSAPPAIEPQTASGAMAPARTPKRSRPSHDAIVSDTGIETAPPSPHATPATAPDATTPAGSGLDLAAARRQARDLGRQPAPPPRLAGTGQAPGDTPLARNIARAARPDCRTVHGDTGLLALPLLIIDTATGHGCAW